MTQPSPHLDLDALADALAGQDSDGSAAHLAGCSSCTSRLAELRAAEVQVVAALAALPPPAVPAGLADRLTAALADEPPLGRRTADASAPTSVNAASVTALPRPAARRRGWLPVAAAGVLLLSGAGLGLSMLSGGGDDSGGDSAASTAAGAVPESDAAGLGPLLTASGTDWADPGAATTALPEVLTGRAPEVELDAGASSDAAGTAPVDGLERLRTTEGLASCLSAVLPAEEPEQLPVAVDYARYGGEPALAVVLPDPDPTTVSVFVVGPGCSAQDDRTLFFFRAPRP